MCDLGHPKNNHDCMLNFECSAKAIFKEYNVRLGILIGDNDSSAICAARNAVDYEIIKHDDINHTSKSVTVLSIYRNLSIIVSHRIKAIIIKIVEIGVGINKILNHTNI